MLKNVLLALVFIGIQPKRGYFGKDTLSQPRLQQELDADAGTGRVVTLYPEGKIAEVSDLSQMRAGREPEQHQACRVDAEVLGVASHMAQATAHVVELGGKVARVDWPVTVALRIRVEDDRGVEAVRPAVTAGHTRGCTTWTTRVQDGGRNYDVVIHCSLRAPGTLTPPVVAEFNRSFKVVRALPCDVPLGDHPAQYNMQAKHARLQGGGANPFVDAENCDLETDIQEAMFRASLDESPK